MKRTIFFAIMALAAFTFMSCDDYETYGEKKEKERDAIAAYIAENNIKVIDEATFTANGEKTSVENNEYVYLEKSGIYMQIERRGAGEKLEENKQVNILCRFAEYNINDSYYQASNMNTNTYPDKFTVQRIGSTITASFIQGVMQSYYGNSVPEGWLIPLLYINIGRQTSADEEISKVNLIVPHSKGQAYAQQSVYACHYVITYQRER
ncbi:MAG: DUF4827 domain-containing protein [Prevotella sp.]|nr:DUF4827 domain-containing protein [Prevotella sp.]MCI7255743.1 DUF4827 domain-containing protein [Prevotella sp.]MDD5785386.1 DUF4827 domain-containing protein [Prevotella sp.]MDY4498812.1 DUF4827 domain-containing protein [Prevotella sp.]